MSVHGTAPRLVELGERQRGAQFEAARPLLLCDADGGPQGFFGWRRVGGIAQQQHFSADAMELRFEGAILGSLACRHRFLNDGDRAVNIAGAGFGFGERNLVEPVEGQSVLIALKLDAAAHVHDPPAKRVGCPGQAVKKDPDCSP